MSIIFKPKIEKWLKSEPPKPRGFIRPFKYWTDEELQKVVELRAIGISLADCAKELKRRLSTISSAIDYHDLYGRIAVKRRTLIDNVMKDVQR